jgi:hypothetical protein
MKKEINWFGVWMVAVLFIGVGGIAYGIYEYKTYEPTKVREATQKTLEYVGFDGKKHQAIVVFTAQHNWVLVEKR